MRSSNDGGRSPAARPALSGRFSDRADLTAFLGAFCFFLSAMEYMLPKPLPFMRLGISNLPILLAVDILPFHWYMVLALVKVIGMSVISGTLFSYVALFSLLGTMMAALAMWAGRRAGGRLVSQVGVSVLGAMVSNATQIFIARYLVFGRAAWLIAPLFLATGLVTGAALGLFAERFAMVSKWYARAAGRVGPAPAADTGAGADATGTVPGSTARSSDADAGGAAGTAPAASARRGAARAAKAARRELAFGARMARRRRFESLFNPALLAGAGALLAAGFLFVESIPVKASLLLVFIGVTWLGGKRFSPLATLSVSAGIVLANLLIPSGKVLATLGPLVVTRGALLEGISKALTFEGLMYVSKATILPGLRLPGRLGGIVASAFVCYDRIVEYKGKIRPATLAADADALMLRVWDEMSARESGDRPA